LSVQEKDRSVCLVLLINEQVITEVRGIKMFSSSYDAVRDLNKYGFSRDFLSLKKSWYKNIEMRHLSSFKSLETRLKNLGLVATEGGYLDDILRRVQSPNLIWLRWYGCTYSSLPSSIPMKNLRVLEVQGTILNRLWPHQSQVGKYIRMLLLFSYNFIL
jgi:hypothetical protein